MIELAIMPPGDMSESMTRKAPSASMPDCRTRRAALDIAPKMLAWSARSRAWQIAFDIARAPALAEVVAHAHGRRGFGVAPGVASRIAIVDRMALRRTLAAPLVIESG